MSQGKPPCLPPSTRPALSPSMHIYTHPLCFLLAPQVEALLDRGRGLAPAIHAITDQLEALGYNSWAYRVVVSAGGVAVLDPSPHPHLLSSS